MILGLYVILAYPGWTVQKHAHESVAFYQLQTGGHNDLSKTYKDL